MFMFIWCSYDFQLQIPQHLTLGLGDKALILLGAGARVATRVLLLYGTTLWQMQLMQAPAASHIWLPEGTYI